MTLEQREPRELVRPPSGELDAVASVASVAGVDRMFPPAARAPIDRPLGSPPRRFLSRGHWPLTLRRSCAFSAWAAQDLTVTRAS